MQVGRCEMSMKLYKFQRPVKWELGRGGEVVDSFENPAMKRVQTAVSLSICLAIVAALLFLHGATNKANPKSLRGMMQE